MLSQSLTMAYVGAAVSWVALRSSDASQTGSWLQVSLVPCATLCLWLAVHLLEPSLVSAHKRWMARSQKAVIFLTLGSECLLCSFLPAYLANHELLPKSEDWRAATLLVLRGCISMLAVGTIARQTLDPLYPGYFLDRPVMIMSFNWMGFAVGALLAYTFSVYSSASF